MPIRQLAMPRFAAARIVPAELDVWVFIVW
jgi:hypothetical protein